jgi:hypothetical protein
MKSLNIIAAVMVATACLSMPAHARELTESQNKALSEIYVSDGFNYMSGNTQPLHNQPAIYAYYYGKEGGGARLVVVGQDFRQEFWMHEWAKAIEAYKELLARRGYRPDGSVEMLRVN